MDELIDPVTRQVREGVTKNTLLRDGKIMLFKLHSETNLTMGGGEGKTNYFTSFGYLKDQGSINSDFERLSTRVSINHEVKSWLKGGVNFGYSYSKSNNNGQSEDSGSVFGLLTICLQFILFEREADGSIIQDPVYGGNKYDYGQTGRRFGGLTNAISDATREVDQTGRHELNMNVSLMSNLLKV
jgi:hypothetical protein